MKTAMSAVIGAIAGALLEFAPANAQAPEIPEQLIPPHSNPGTPSIETYKDESYSGTATEPQLRTGSIDWQSLSNPPMLDWPWARWWWPGGDVEANLLNTQLDVLKEAGFGGVEIQPFSNGLLTPQTAPMRERVMRFDTPEYYDILNEFMSHADSIGIQVDINHHSGWPAGGPHVLLEDGLMNFVYAEMRIEGGRKISLDLPAPTPNANAHAMAIYESATKWDFYNFPSGHERLVSVVAAKHLDGERPEKILDLTDTIRLDSNPIVLDSLVNDGKLEWDAPEGDWIIVATYIMPAGEPPLFIARPTSGFVVDHIRLDPLIGHYNYAFGERSGLLPHYGKAFRGFFNDSLEFRLDHMASADFLDEFQNRRGYDLRPYLPVVFVDAFDNFYVRDSAGMRAAPGFAMTDLDDRIRHDFVLTRSDLLIERFAEGSAEWAAERGLVSRAQGYGTDLDVIRAQGASHIPETEQLYGGGSELFLKLTSSAALLYDRPVVSAESFVFAGREYEMTPRHIKAAANLLFFTGINQIVYHGYSYQTQGQANDAAYDAVFGDLGWYPWSWPGAPFGFTANVSPTDSLWNAIPEINRYLARCQSLLKAGEPQVDLFIYYPFMGFPSSYAKSEEAAKEFMFKGYLPGETILAASGRQAPPQVKLPEDQEDERIAWYEEISQLVQALNERGITWLWINDHALQHGLGRGANQAHAPVLIFETSAMPLESTQALRALADQGNTALFYGETPATDVGFLDALDRDAKIAAIISEIAADGSLTSTNEVVEKIKSEVRFTEPSAIRRASRKIDTGEDIHFFTNFSLDTATATALFSSNPDDLARIWFDPMTGDSWPAQIDENGALQMTIEPLGARFLVSSNAIPVTKRPLADRVLGYTGDAEVLSGWTLEIGDQKEEIAHLFDWREEDFTKHADRGVYRTIFAVDKVDTGYEYIIDLGRVEGTAQVAINGAKIGTVLTDPFVLDITPHLRAGENSVEVVLVAPLRNSLVGRALAGDATVSQMARHQNALTAAGLLGPVRIIQLESKDGH